MTKKHLTRKQILPNRRRWTGLLLASAGVLVSLQCAAGPGSTSDGMSDATSGSTSGSMSSSMSDAGDWISLFNGRDLTGWHTKISGYALDDNFKNTFRVLNGNFRISYDDYADDEYSPGHIYYEQSFSHYRLRADYRFVGASAPRSSGRPYRRNNGFMIHSQDPATIALDQDWPVSIEIQFLGSAEGGTREISTGNMCSPGTHIVMDGELQTRHCINSNSQTYYGEEWVTIEVEVLGSGTIKHWINGVLVMEYEQPQLDENDEDAQRLLAAGADVMLSEGYIAIQSEGFPIEFRSIEVLPLDE